MTDSNNQENDVRTLAMSRASIMKGVKKRRVGFLDIKRINEQVQTYRLDDSDTIIGRTSDNLIKLAYANISRHHSKISPSNETYSIEDLESTNGTYVNGISIAKCVLHPNDIIQIGDTHLFYYEREEIIS
ncbi:FHA domain-containing protein [Lentisphaera profundi]|uniref:FHA domain-containing protein n=1 Tax=Lentisphaera profundi TaxID=1658616 RepID=A0ABY7VND7_9BACT|nr:FHA domain-containing protein [Lentisphaera profundi]WDE95628.1 FHA domain-containing protein [Lentisphaera profundi]